MTKQLLDLIRKKFQEALQAKTGWGRNDLIAVYDKAVADALAEYQDTLLHNFPSTQL